MAIPSTGSISMSDIQTEFGGSNPISLSEYYAGGGQTPAGTTGNNGTVPSSGAIDMGDFRGSTNAVYMDADGGTETTSGDYKFHKFNSSGTFSVNTVGNPAGSNTIDYIIVAGGAGSSHPGNWTPGGGGGGGGGDGPPSVFHKPKGPTAAEIAAAKANILGTDIPTTRPVPTILIAKLVIIPSVVAKLLPSSTITDDTFSNVSPFVCAIASNLARPNAAFSTVKLVVVARVETVFIKLGRFCTAIPN